MIIRTASPGDAVAIAEVHVRTWQVAYRGLIPQAYLDGLDPARRAERWTRSLSEPRPAGTTLVAELDGRVIGFVDAGRCRDEDATDDVGEVRAIYVHPDEWDTGAGRELMIAALKSLQDSGFSRAWLWVVDTNERARRFYERGGWTCEGSVQDVEPFGGKVVEVRYERALS